MAGMGRKQTLGASENVVRFRRTLGIVIVEASVQLRKSLFQKGNVFRVRRLGLPEIRLVDVRDLSGLNAFEELHEPVSLLMPVLRTHDRLRNLRSA
jgi:hypothetical protein